MGVAVFNVGLRCGEEVDVEWVGVVVACMAEEVIKGLRPVSIGVEVPGVDGDGGGV